MAPQTRRFAEQANCHPSPGRTRAESEGEMISLRLAVPAVLLAAALAGCITYFVNPPPRTEVDQRLPPSLPPIDQRPSAQEQAPAAFERAAAAIIRRAAYAQAAANEQPIAGHIPLPKRRPLPRWWHSPLEFLGSAGPHVHGKKKQTENSVRTKRLQSVSS
jgi:hypothetical protein